jgi:catechol 2,3-dioxygenase-like lactoylglutathione lyase family enzyme
MIIRLFLIILLTIPQWVHSQGKETDLPVIWGIAKMTFLVSNFQVARDYYGRFLGFDEAFTYSSDLGPVIAFKINDRQFLEFVEDLEAPAKNRLVSVSFETEDVEQMRNYLKYNGVNVPDKTSVDGAGNGVLLVHDLSGNPIEFIQYIAGGLHLGSRGRFLSEHRISGRIHHVGLYSGSIMDNDPFYAGILRFSEILRYPEDKSLAPIILYLGIGEGVENIEHYSPNDRDFSHPCFLVEDMQETIYTLKERRVNERLEKPIIGKGGRWILNLRNSDQTRVEFTEGQRVR